MVYLVLCLLAGPTRADPGEPSPGEDLGKLFGALVDAASATEAERSRVDPSRPASIEPWRLDLGACTAALLLHEAPAGPPLARLDLERQAAAASLRVVFAPDRPARADVLLRADDEPLSLAPAAHDRFAISAPGTAPVWKALARADSVTLESPASDSGAALVVPVPRLGRVWRRLGKCQQDLAEPGPREARGPVADPSRPMTRPELLFRPDERYTEAARRARIQGVVIVEATIDVTGRVREAVVVKGLPYGLDDAALDAAYGMRFKPATQDGRAVETPFMLTFNFRLP